jgi:phospholipase C
MFLTDTASSFVAHQLIISGTVRYNGYQSLTDQPDHTPWGCDAPQGTKVPLLFLSGYEKFNGVYPCFTQYHSIAELLDAANVSWQFYVEQGLDSRKPYFDFSGAAWNGFDAIAKVRCASFRPPMDCDGYGSDWKNHISIPNTTVFADLKSGRLPAVSWVIPTIFDSDHPDSGCNGGPRWVTRVVNAIGTSRYWKNTAIILLWDDWGGWYDPVPPRQFNYTSLGMRIPMILISPYAKPHYISETTYNYGSILRFVEETFKLGSLGTTDKTANSLADSFDYSQPPNVFKAAPWPPRSRCKTSSSADIVRQIIEHDGGVPE